MRLECTIEDEIRHIDDQINIYKNSLQKVIVVFNTKDIYDLNYNYYKSVISIIENAIVKFNQIKIRLEGELSDTKEFNYTENMRLR